MSRMSITFYDDTYRRIQMRAEKKGGQSIAEAVRELTELGLRVEAAASEHGPKNSVNEGADHLKKLLELNLKWSLEARLIGRFLVAHNPALDKEKQAEVLEKYPDRVEEHIRKVMNEKF